MNNYKVGIVGLGKVARLHADALKEISNASFTAACSRTLAKAEVFASEYGATPFDNITSMVRESKLDLVIICTPHPNHLEPTVEALEAGAHVLVEKPLASSLQDCDTMIEAARHTGLKLGVISQRRWYPPTLRIKNAMDQGKIGKPVLGTINMLGWRDEAYYESDEWRGTWDMEGGGVMVNQAPHQLDLFCWLMGEIDEVYGHWANLNHPYIEVEDTALAIVKFKNGAIGNIVLSNSQKPGIFGKIQVHGENGASVGVQTEGGAMFIAGMAPITEPPVNDLWTIPGEEHLLEEFTREDDALFEKVNPMVYFIRLQIEEYLEALDQGREPLVNGEEARKTVELFTAIYRSTRDNKPVKFPLSPESGRKDYDGRKEAL
ncbi:MAG: Gfo/Idh/MocA family oxidoreductase [Bacteroidia bacterium]|nr:MAG: Gfo/Idh/MocA family oxidoreductase [Bacteroidia bacterium]